MRSVVSVLVAGTLMVGLTAPEATAYASWRNKEARYQYVDHHKGWSGWEVKLTIRWAARHWGVSYRIASYIANRESHFGQYARNPTSGTCGVFQHMPSYFIGRLRSVKHHKPWLRPFGWSCYNARDNVLAAMWMMKSSYRAWSM